MPNGKATTTNVTRAGKKASATPGKNPASQPAVKTAGRDKGWREEWRATQSVSQTPRPTDAIFAEAEQMLADPLASESDRRAAALKGLPAAVAADTCFPMWIPAKFLTATFSDMEIMTSLGSDPQPATWTSSIAFLRDFKCIRNAGVSFVCTDREICTKLGNLKLKICNKEFSVQPYSKYSHWYYADLQRLPDDVLDTDIYDWFADQGTPPVYITPAQEINGLKSRSRRVYFNHKDPPASLMLDTKTPVREIQFSAGGFCVVQHRVRAYNKEMPPFLKALKSRKTESGKKNSGNNQGETAHTENGDDWEMGDKGDTQSEISMEAPPESSDDGDLDLQIKPESIWPKTPHGAVFDEPAGEGSNVYQQVERARKRFSPHTVARTFRQVTLEFADNGYSWAASRNTYEVLANGGDDDPIAPDYELMVRDENGNELGSMVARSRTATELLVNQYETYDAEKMTLEALCTFLDNYASKFVDEPNAETLTCKIQAQPSLHRPFYDTSCEANYGFFAPMVAEHAVMRLVADKTPDLADSSHSERLATLNLKAHTEDTTGVLQELTRDQDTFWHQMHLAEIDLFLQINAPSVYNDPLKIAELTQTSPQVLSSLWHLWADTTLIKIATSALGTKITAAKLPTQVRTSLAALQKTAEHLETQHAL